MISYPSMKIFSANWIYNNVKLHINGVENKKFIKQKF